MSERLAGGLWCREVLAELDLYVSGELDADALQAVTEHVESCDNCARFGGAYAAVITSLRSPSPVVDTEGWVERLRARLDDEA